MALAWVRRCCFQCTTATAVPLKCIRNDGLEVDHRRNRASRERQRPEFFPPVADAPGSPKGTAAYASILHESIFPVTTVGLPSKRG
jgi:hypothetical protein